MAKTKGTKKKPGAVAAPVPEPEVLDGTVKPQVVKEKQTLRIYLTDDQKHDERTNIIELLGRAENIDADKKASMAVFAQQVAEVKQAISNKRKRIADGYDGLVDCERTLDYGSGRVRVVRMDTGAVIEEREMVYHEKQMRLGAGVDEVAHQPEEAEAPEDGEEGEDA